MKYILIFFVSIFLYLFITCSKADKGITIQTTFDEAEGNKVQLQKVIEHYEQLGDYSKKDAATFLITNMYFKYSYSGDILNCYDTILYLFKDLRQQEIYIGDPPIIKKTWDSIVKTHGDIKIDHLDKNFDSKTLKADFLINNIDFAFQTWKNAPNYVSHNLDDFYEYVLPYRIQKEPVEEYRERYYKELKHIIDTARSGLSLQIAFNEHFAKNNHYRPSQLMWEYPIELPVSKMEIGRRGACRHMTTFGVMVMRACGLPVTIDRAVWANRSMGHSWNVLLLDSAKILPFDALSKDPFRLIYKPAKIFRQKFSYNINVSSKINKVDIPPSFLIFDEDDVTNEYVKAYDITIPINYPKTEYKNKRNGIICVFDNSQWRPVYWGEINSGKMSFEKMAVDIAYIGAYYEDGKIIPATYPFLLQENGKIHFYTPNKNKVENFKLERKFPRFKRIEDFAMGLRRTNAEAANDINFANPTLLFSVYDVPYNVSDSIINNTEKYRFVRFNSSTYRQANFAEVEFYGKKTLNSNEQKLTGKIIGYPPIDEAEEHPYTHAMDGNMETWFQKQKNTVGWVGLDLGKGNEHIITRVRFCPRSDTNFILKGDTYELLYWNGDDWNSHAIKKASEFNAIEFKNVPTETFYLLKNHSRGKEERIFTYENGKQIWW